MSATVQKMDLLKLGLLMEAIINLETTLRLTAFFFSVRREDNLLTAMFVVLNIDGGVHSNPHLKRDKCRDKSRA